jgi:hypothetical protein
LTAANIVVEDRIPAGFSLSPLAANSIWTLLDTVRFNTMLLYGIADAGELKAKHFTDEETRLFLIKNNLKEPLTIAGEWRWKD